MTGYCIEVGYNSGHDKADVWEEIEKVIADIRANPDCIGAEVMRVEKEPEGGSIADLIRHTDHYKDCDDLTIMVHADHVDGDGEPAPYVGQTASSGNGFRGIKEQCRRAVCRLVLKAMHSKGMEINIIVT